MGRRSTLCTPVPVRFRQNAAATTLKHGPAPFDWTHVELGLRVLCLAVAFISVPAFGVALSVPPWLLLLQRNKFQDSARARESARARVRNERVSAHTRSGCPWWPPQLSSLSLHSHSEAPGAEMQQCQSLSTRTDSWNLRVNSGVQSLSC